LKKRAAFDLRFTVLQDVESATTSSVYGGKGYAEEGWNDGEGSLSHEDGVNIEYRYVGFSI
jgi:hypothetical protein